MHFYTNSIYSRVIIFSAKDKNTIKNKSLSFLVMVFREKEFLTKLFIKFFILHEVKKVEIL